MITMEVGISLERFVQKILTPSSKNSSKTSESVFTKLQRNGFSSHHGTKINGFAKIPKTEWDDLDEDDDNDVEHSNVLSPTTDKNGICVKFSRAETDDCSPSVTLCDDRSVDPENQNNGEDPTIVSRRITQEEELDQYYAEHDDIDEDDKFVLIDMEVLLRKGHQAEEGFACRRIVDRQDSFVHVNPWSLSLTRDPCCNTEKIYLQGYREEPSSVTYMDISSGHMILEYMEDHSLNGDRLNEEWGELCRYEPEFASVAAAMDNKEKNKGLNSIPYDHSRVKLCENDNESHSDYINASFIRDHDPSKPTYIAAQHPLSDTVTHFWQMIWEQNVVIIVNLTSNKEYEQSSCQHYWPTQGSELYHIYEVHLVSEHRWCNEYVVRSFYIHNVVTDETRTVTQYHYCYWADLSLPISIESILNFRKNVNKSYKGIACPILVHCSDGCGRTGTYCLMDLTLTRIAKGAKEIDIAATLEHFRDQRMNMVSSKEQFDFVLASVATGVLAVLRIRPK